MQKISPFLLKLKESQIELGEGCVNVAGYVYLMYSHSGTCIYLHTHKHICSFFPQLSYLDIGCLELELPEEIIITLQVASPTGTVFHNEQELKVNWDNDCLIPFFE